MRLLLIPLATGVGLGPMTRCLAIAHEAKRRGHEVVFLCKEAFCKIAKKFGYTTYTAPTSSRYQGVIPPPFRLSDVAIELGWVKKSYVISAIETERKLIRSFRPDVIFTETQFSVPISASVENVPWVAATSWADHPDFKSPLYDGNCAGINSAIESSTYEAEELDHELYGINDGWAGLIDFSEEHLNSKKVDGIGEKCGTILGTSRTNPFPLKDGDEDRSRIVIENLKKHKYDALIVIGIIFMFL